MTESTEPQEALPRGAETGTCVWDADSGKLLRKIPNGGDVLSRDGRLVARRGNSVVRLHSLKDGRPLHTILSARGQQFAAISPEGHYRGSRGVKKELIYVVQTDSGQETLAADDFAKKYDWKNAPAQVKPLP